MFLENASNEDLDILIKYLVYDYDGNKRFAEGLSSNSRYIQYQPHHKLYWDLIAEEVQRFGANSVVTFLRGGEGVLYREVLTDVCDKFEVKYDKKSSTEAIESDLLQKVLSDSLELMSPEELEGFCRFMDFDLTEFTLPAILLAVQLAIRKEGFKSYKIILSVANGVAKSIFGKGLSFGVNAKIMKGVSRFAGPIGLTVTGMLALLSIAGPEYRVTMPSVIHIAYMRSKIKGNTPIKGAREKK